MKFCVTWSSKLKQIEDLPLRNHCINYKAWKKFTKKTAPSRNYLHTLLDLLEFELHKLNGIFEKEVRKLFPGSSYIEFKSLLCINNDHASTSKTCRKQKILDLATFSELNKTTIYKICKRFDKRFQVTLYKTWLKTQTQRLYSGYNILGGFWTRRLGLELKENKSEPCPICFDDAPSTMIMLSCGHTVCKSCLMSYHGLSGMRGTFLNIVNYKMEVEHKHLLCPYCRSKTPYSGFDEYHIIPHTMSQKFLSQINH